VDQPYVLTDPKLGRAELMMPGDPAAPIGFSVNCRCTQNTIHPQIGLIGSSLDGRIAAEWQRREKMRERKAQTASRPRKAAANA